MKNITVNYFAFLIIMLLTRFGFGQIGFEEITVLNEIDSNNNSTYFPIVSSDIDGDGDKDIFTLIQGNIYWYENLNGLGNYGPKILIPEDFEETPEQLLIEDLDNDGFNDLIVRNDDGIFWFKNMDGLGDFDNYQSIYSNSNMPPIELVDIDDDGDLDILSAEWLTILLLKNDGSNNFTSVQTIDPTTFGNVLYRDAIAIDLDNDGDKDILTVFYNWDGDDYFLWLENDGLEDFTQVHIIDNDVQIFQGAGGTLRAGDIDGDGDLDALLSVAGGIDWYENIDGNGTFSPTSTDIGSTAMSGTYDFEVEDLNNDNHLDVIYQNPSPNNLKVSVNDGSGTFPPQQIMSIPLSSGVHPFLLDDINNDGNKDVVAITRNQFGLSWFDYNTGNYDIAKQIASFDLGLIDVLSIDFDNDGDNDIITKSSMRISTYENIDGFGSFGKQKVQHLQSSSINAKNFHFSDFDNDGDLDILTSQNITNQLIWIENIDFNTTSNNIHYFPDTIEKPAFVFSADLDGDLDKDAIVGGKDKLVLC